MCVCMCIYFTYIRLLWTCPYGHLILSVQNEECLGCFRFAFTNKVILIFLLLEVSRILVHIESELLYLHEIIYLTGMVCNLNVVPTWICLMAKHVISISSFESICSLHFPIAFLVVQAAEKRYSKQWNDIFPVCNILSLSVKMQGFFLAETLSD